MKTKNVRVGIVVCLLGIVVGMAGCGKIYPEEAELRAVLERNLKGNQEENIDLALKDLDDSVKSETRLVLKDMFEKYDLSYKLVSVKVISVEGDTAEVRVVQDTKKISGPAFQDNRLTAVHTLKKRADGWKIAATKIEQFKKL